ncbi:MAG: hypothetical protein PHH93_06535 [Prolixibacteraceae bacterium]|nr:hypothetical protein [Prolixibacteraceae bacterium]
MKFPAFIFLMLAVYAVTAQDKLMPVLPAEDSVMTESTGGYKGNNLSLTNLPAGEFMELQVLPAFDISSALSGLRNYYSFDISDRITNIYMSPGFQFAANPFIRDGKLFSGAEYKVGDNLIIGGESFGGNSVFSAPFPGQNINNYDFRGSSLFMKYNISKKFKIETHINVIQSPGF